MIEAKTKEQLFRDWANEKPADDSLWVRLVDVKNLKDVLKHSLKGQCSAEDVLNNVFIFEEERIDSIVDDVFKKSFHNN